MMLIEHIVEDTQRRLAILSQKATIADAAEILSDPKTPLAVVCDADGVAVGVISKTDIVKVARRGSSTTAVENAATIMTKEMLSCQATQTLQNVWTAMSGRGIRCIPVLDDARRPVGVVHARDLARALLNDAANEELLLRDYVLGIGYQ